tara:strand:+ start:701 stop:850 length:150 start_codon:yes stop_codon:yes gene_type:complete
MKAAAAKKVVNTVSKVFGNVVDKKYGGQLPDQKTLRKIAKDYFTRKILK